VAKDRQFQFDYSAMTPGPKARSWEDVISCLVSELSKDSYVDARAAIRTLAFDNLDQMHASEKVLRFAAGKNWIPESELDALISANEAIHSEV
jgi:hypothetical protein